MNDGISRLTIHWTVFIDNAMQELIVFLTFAVALVYLGNRAYQSLTKKEEGCGKGCGCAADSKAATVSVKERL